MKQQYTLLFSILFLFVGGIHAQNTLQYDLKKGDVFVVRQQAEQIITQEIQGTRHILTNNMDGVLRFKVLGEVEGAYAIEFTFEDLNIKVNSSIQGEVMNVRAKEVTEGDVQSMMFNSLLGSPVNMTLSKTGAILEVVGGDGLIAKMVGAAGIEDEFTLDMMKKSLEKEFGSKALSDSYEQLTFIYPNKPVNEGDAWQNEYTGKLNAKNTWTLVGMTHANANIKGTADVVMEIEEPAVTMNLTGVQNTEVTTDNDSGFIIKMIVKGSAEGTSTMAQVDGQKIPTNIESTITYELITE